MITEIKENLKELICQTSKKLYPSLDPSAIVLEIPSDKKFGEYSCNIAMRLASLLKKNPVDTATTISKLIKEEIGSTLLAQRIEDIQVVKPGFMNFYLAPKALFDILESVLELRNRYGQSQKGKGQKIQVEFVSANPTGPLSVAHARQAAVGDALGNILKFLGYEVKKEFYVNDEGNQINILGRSIELRGREILGEKVEFLEDGYQGDYIGDMARIFMDREKLTSIAKLNAKDPADFRRFGVDHLMAVIQKELNDFGVHFDIWSFQSKIATNPEIEKVLNELKTRGFIYEQEGAVWFKSTALGDDKDRVVKKSDGNYTYLTPDIVYHKDKFDRGFNRLINIWGPDHHGYIPRIKAAVQAMGRSKEALDVLIVQLATIFRDGKPLSMSTRRGQYISLREVMDEVGCDAARFFFLMRHIKAHLELDLELAKKQTAENPVYYIQYAHARISSILKMAAHPGLVVAKKFQRLKEVEELDLIKKISQFPEVVSICAHQLDPYLLTAYLQELASTFHKFYDRNRIIDAENKALSSERLALSEATRIVLANGLTLLGLSSPEKM